MMDKYINTLSNRVFRTKDARFAASHRMARSKIASKAAEAFLSASIIAISLISLQMDNQDTSKLMSVFTVILSTFLLVLSLLFSSLDYARRYDNYNNCALELDCLYHRIEFLLGGDIESFWQQKLSEQYDNILAKYNQNHTKFDVDYSLLSNSDVQISKHRRIWLNIRYYIFDVYLLYWLIAILPVCVILWYYLSVIIDL